MMLGLIMKAHPTTKDRELAASESALAIPTAIPLQLQRLQRLRPQQLPPPQPPLLPRQTRELKLLYLFVDQEHKSNQSLVSKAVMHWQLKAPARNALLATFATTL